MMLRLLGTGRVLLGAVLLVEPDAILDRVSRRRARAVERALARLLGLRNLAEGALVGRHSSRGRLLAGAAVDTTHALSMVALAVIRPEHRRIATAAALAAIATAGAGLVAAHGAPVEPPQKRGYGRRR